MSGDDCGYQILRIRPECTMRKVAVNHLPYLKIHAGIAVAVAKIEERGWKGDTCMITPDAAGRALLEDALIAPSTTHHRYNRFGRSRSAPRRCIGRR
jgi:hypothetical protein